MKLLLAASAFALAIGLGVAGAQPQSGTAKNPNSAAPEAPGQIQKKTGVSARKVAPGQVQKRTGVSASKVAPGHAKRPKTKTGSVKPGTKKTDTH